MEAQGRHLLLELHECDPALLDDREHVRDSLLEAARSIGATIIDDTFHQFSPQGVSGVVVIAESHCSIHTWPELGYAAIDVFTCNLTLDPLIAARQLRQRLRAGRAEYQLVQRGIASPAFQPLDAALVAATRP